MKGFYCLEGIDGCGKSTQINSLIQNLSTKGHVCLKIREPGGTEVGEKIRNILLSPGTNALSNKAELLLYNAARAQLIEQIIQPALALQRVVLADRFAWSTLAYQGYGRQLDIAEIQSIIDLACGDIWPQKTFILDIPVSEFRRRSQAEERNPDRIEQEKEVFFERVRFGYQELAKQNPDSIVLLDGTQSPETVQRTILQHILTDLEETT